MSVRVEKLEEDGFERGKLAPEEVLTFLEDRKYVCPCCDKEFSERHVQTGKLKLLGHDSGLAPHYSPIDPLLYDVVICRHCGYGALVKTFDNLSFKNAQVIISSLPEKFKKIEYPRIYTEEIAIKRYRIALINALLIREKSSVAAYIYMRLAWIYRSMNDANTERRMMLASYEGFLEASKRELFPIIDLDQCTTYYIMADFLCRLGRQEEAERFFEKALNSEGIDNSLRKRIMERPFMSDK